MLKKTNYIKLYQNGSTLSAPSWFTNFIKTSGGQSTGQQMNDQLYGPGVSAPGRDAQIMASSTTQDSINNINTPAAITGNIQGNSSVTGSYSPSANSSNGITGQQVTGVLGGITQGWNAISNANNLKGTQRSTALGDGIEGAVSSTLSAFGPWGQVAGAALNLVNGIGGSLMNGNQTARAASKFTVNNDVQQSGSYGGIANDANTAKADGQSYRKAGLFGKLFASPGHLQDEMTQSTAQQNQVAGILNTAKQARQQQAGGTDLMNSQLQQKNYNTNTWGSGQMTFGKAGMKLLPKAKDGIHIKKSHEGRFTAWKKRTGETTEEGKHSSNPKIRKEATFAANVAKWSHKRQAGGSLEIPYEYQPRLGASKNYTAGYGQGYGTAFQFTQDSPFKNFLDNLGGAQKMSPQVSPGLESSQQMSNSTIRNTGFIDSDNIDYLKGQRDSFDQLIKSQPQDQRPNAKNLVKAISAKVPTGELGMQIQKHQLGGSISQSGSNQTKTTQEYFGKLGQVAKQVNLKKVKAIKKKQQGGVMQQDATKMVEPDLNDKIMNDSNHGYTKWLASLPSRLNESNDYDLKGYFDKYGPVKIQGEQHLTNEFKKPNHVTFSNESIYNNPEHQGGEWRKAKDDKWEFVASPWNIKNVGINSLQTYFKQNEPNSHLILPPVSHADGGPINVIPDGAFHSRKHDLKELPELEDANITLKGIPVVSEGKKGEVIQSAEIETQELILHYDLTKELEKLHKEGTDEAAYEAGKLLALEIVKNTKDNTGKFKLKVK
jgi:hypothetical protein